MAGVKDDFERVNELEAELVKTRTELLVIAQSLQFMADRYASPQAREHGITSADVDMLYGASSLIENVAAECYRVYEGGE